MILLGVARSAIIAPNGISLDIDGNCFNPLTYFAHDESRSKWDHCKDVALSLLLEALITLQWHGMWTLEDISMEETGTSTEISAWWSVVRGKTFDTHCAHRLICTFPPNRHQLLGLESALAIFVLQFPMLLLYKTDRVGPFPKLLGNAFYCCIGGFSTVCSYRGVWLLLDVYFMPGKTYGNLKGEI